MKKTYILLIISLLLGIAIGIFLSFTLLSETISVSNDDFLRKEEMFSESRGDITLDIFVPESLKTEEEWAGEFSVANEGEPINGVVVVEVFMDNEGGVAGVKDTSLGELADNLFPFRINGPSINPHFDSMHFAAFTGLEKFYEPGTYTFKVSVYDSKLINYELGLEEGRNYLDGYNGDPAQFFTEKKLVPLISKSASIEVTGKTIDFKCLLAEDCEEGLSCVDFKCVKP